MLAINSNIDICEHTKISVGKSDRSWDWECCQSLSIFWKIKNMLKKNKPIEISGKILEFVYIKAQCFQICMDRSSLFLLPLMTLILEFEHSPKPDTNRHQETSLNLLPM